jgi:6-phosphogluconolactonase
VPSSISIHESPLLAAQACAVHVEQLLHQALLERGVATFAVSGGSTPKLMFDALAVSGLDWGRIHLFWVDERCVPPDDEQSNYLLARNSLIGPAGIPDANVHRVPGELPPVEAAAQYEAELRKHFGASETPVFDVLHCGMGPDAHTASLFPGDSSNIRNRDGLTAAVYAPKLPNWRVTLLPAVLLAARHSLMLVTGADKADTVFDVLRGETYDPVQRPVQLVQREGKNVAWFLDRAAGARLGG